MSYTNGWWRANSWATSDGALPQTIKIYSGKLLVAETPYYKNCKYHNFVNARRIAACVNACAGIPTEELEARINGHNAQVSGAGTASA